MVIHIVLSKEKAGYVSTESGISHILPLCCTGKNISLDWLRQVMFL